MFKVHWEEVTESGKSEGGDIEGALRRGSSKWYE